MSSAYLGFECLKLGSLLSCLWLSGRAVQAGYIRVNYTRKINHFLLFLWQFTLRDMLAADVGAAVHALDQVLTFALTIAIFARPLRDRSPALATMFAAYDRPEDRPFTLRWLSLQLLLTYAIAAPLHLYFLSLGRPELLTILILVNGIGDGLAEPVGVRFGRRRYTVRALFTRRLYQRSFEGSACVFASALLALWLYSDLFTSSQWIAALLLLPPVVTLAEARAPHTFDSPLIFLIGGAALGAVAQLS